jgi:hypothetical protein
MACIHSGHDAGPGRRTNRCAGIKLREQHAFPGQPVYIRRTEFSLTITSRVAIPEVIGKYKNNIRLNGITFLNTRGIKHDQKKTEGKPFDFPQG